MKLIPKSLLHYIMLVHTHIPPAAIHSIHRYEDIEFSQLLPQKLYLLKQLLKFLNKIPK